MNKILFIIASLLVAFSVQAQDVIVRNDGSTILAKVQKVTENEVEYKKHSNPDGPTYTITISEITAINYENGAKDTFKTSKSSSATISNQSDQTYMTNETASQFSNDKQLLSMYNSNIAPTLKYRKKAKTWKLTGIIGGSALVVGGVAAFLFIDEESLDYGSYISLATAGIGVVGGLTCYLIGNHYSNLAKKYSIYDVSLFQHNFEFNNGNSMALCVDMLSSNNNRDKALGLGIQYHF